MNVECFITGLSSRFTPPSYLAYTPQNGMDVDTDHVPGRYKASQRLRKM